jgi:hypothetical protein
MCLDKKNHMTSVPFAEQRRPRVKFAVPKVKPLEEDEVSAELVTAAVHEARQTVAQQRTDLAWCHAVATAELSLRAHPDGAVVMSVPAQSSVLVFPDTRTQDWVGARAVNAATGAVTDGWVHNAALSHFYL